MIAKTTRTLLLSPALLLGMTLFSATLNAQEADDGVWFKMGERDPVTGLSPNMDFSLLGDVTEVGRIMMSTGDEALSGLLEYAEERQMPQAFVTGVGGFESAVFSWYDAEQDLFKEIPVDMKGEVVSFYGSLSYQEGQASVHVHALLSLEDGTVRGGHLVSGQVGPVLQIFAFEMGGED